MTSEVIPPPVVWAQRKDILMVTIQVPDCVDPVIKLDADKLFFKAVGGDLKHYEISMEFLEDVDTDKSRYKVLPRQIEFYLRKKTEGPFWKRLLKTDVKAHWLKVDFQRWKDEDDSDDDEFDRAQNLDEMMRQMGGLGSVEKPDMDDLDMDGEDSDDEQLPDLED